MEHHVEESIFRLVFKFRFLYSIDYAEAAYASDVDGILERCKCIRSRDWIKDLVHESTPDCPAFFLAVDPDNWKVLVETAGAFWQGYSKILSDHCGYSRDS